MWSVLSVGVIAIRLATTAVEAAVAPGEVNCRYTTTSSASVNYYTCTELADWYYITVEQFFLWNPTVNKECSNVKPNTEYCVDGFIQPALSTDGLCGPQNGNTSCIETDMPCCNGETWKCGNLDSCLPGTCYSGACLGFPSEYSMDGKCGSQNKNLKCGGKWGSCCSAAGKCGTGEEFCGVNKCQSGNCTMIIPSWTPPEVSSTSMPVAVPTPTAGSISPDGSCGGTNKFVCKGSKFGDCCSSSGFCGSTTAHCTAGCQVSFGNCTSTDISPDGTCGGTNKYKCKGSAFGDCCSSSGYCGSSTTHCTAGCQTGFGTCTGTSLSPDGTCGGSKKYQCKGSGYGDCCSSSGYCGSTSGHCTAGCQGSFGTCTVTDISPDGTCGGTNKYKCKGSPFGNCCSSSGYCGDTTAHCQAGCQSQFGTCSATASTTKPSSPTGVSTDGTCGGSKGLKCQGSPFGNCCSSGGYCGDTVQHCAQGCQKSFSSACLTANVPTLNGDCGDSKGGYTCANGPFNGQCCSTGGFCGSTDTHCKSGCQKGYGACK
ncbi:hypothetical protein HBH99_208780 [Parastagonospora nodorum]|nr:hypothetical protein HBH99_208780 [Parastagonospora nodorum]